MEVEGGCTTGAETAVSALGSSGAPLIGVAQFFENGRRGRFDVVLMAAFAVSDFSATPCDRRPRSGIPLIVEALLVVLHDAGPIPGESEILGSAVAVVDNAAQAQHFARREVGAQTENA